MADRLLQTKLFIPTKRPFLIHRARLHQQLDSGRDSRLTLVAAPAGFGKTTLVTSWLAEQTSRQSPIPNRAIAWLSLDDNDRDAEILHTIAAGLSNSAIQEKLFISKNTVRTHIKNLYSKLGVNSRTAAVAKARELRLLEPEWFQPP